MKISVPKLNRHILSPEFVYVPSHDTDVRKTFARARQEIERERRAQEQRNVWTLKRRTP